MKAKVALFAVAAALVGSASSARASDTGDEFYKGKQIRIVITTNAGGDYDQWARLIIRYMGKNIPGAPTFIPQNMPGAGGIIATNFLYTQAPRDGTTIGMIGRNLPYQALMKEENIRFDPTKFGYIGSPELTNRVCVARGDAPVKRAQDLFEKELLVGGAGAGTAVSMTPTLLANLLGMKFKLVEGYGGSNNVMLALERGEVQGICQTISSIRNTKPGWIEDGRLKVLFNTERQPISGVDAPSVFEFVKTEEQRRILALYTSSVELGRPMVVPPEVPAERLAILRKAFLETLADKELQSEAERQGLELGVVKGEDLASLIGDLLSTPPDIVAKTQAYSK